MAHYAYVNDGIVTDVIVGRDETDIPDGFDFATWEDYFSSLGKGQAIRTSYNTYGGVHYTQGFDDNGNRIPSDDQSKALRFNYAGIGFTYNEERDAFIPPKPFESWVLDEDTCLWDAPVPMPEETDADGNPVPYAWDEDAGDWVAVQEPSA